MDPQCTKAAKVEILHIVGRRLQNDLKLEIVLKPIGVFAIPPVRGTPRRLHIGHSPRLRPDNPQKRRGVKRAGTTFYIHRLSDDASPARPIALQSENHILKIHASSMTIAALTRRGIPFRKNSHSRPFFSVRNFRITFSGSAPCPKSGPNDTAQSHPPLSRTHVVPPGAILRPPLPKSRTLKNANAGVILPVLGAKRQGFCR